ncbi:MAG: dephospho-CoA kinase [Pseudoruegeria sp.]
MNRPYLIGLTGSIGMGKSTTAEMFADAGAAVWDADAAVHRLYQSGGAAEALISDLCPASKTALGIDRGVLKQWIQKDPTALGRIEKVVHPLVAADRADFIKSTDADIVILDIPLLFETGAEAQFDMIVVVSTSGEAQKQRVMVRAGMTAIQFDTILAKQIPDAEKRKRADVVIDTTSHETAQAGVKRVMQRAIQGRTHA